MKEIILILFLLFINLAVIAQKSNMWTDVDTIKVHSDKIEAQLKTYKDSMLIKDARAYLYPIIYEISLFRRLPNLYKRKIIADSIVFHGTVKKMWEEGKYFIGEYSNGEQQNVTYYDSVGVEISRRDFYNGLRSHWNPEQGTNMYFFKERKKKDKKRK